MRTSISFSGGETLIAHLAWRESASQHVFVFLASRSDTPDLWCHW